MIRVEKKHILDRTGHEYFKGWDGDKGLWTPDMNERGVNLRFPENREDKRMVRFPQSIEYENEQDEQSGLQMANRRALPFLVERIRKDPCVGVQ